MAQENCLEDLQEIIDYYVKDSASKKNQMNDNLLKIQELEHYIDTLCNSEDNDIKVFSPRGVERIHKDDIEKAKNEIFDLNKINISLSSDIENNQRYVTSLQQALFNIHISDSNTNVIDKNNADKNQEVDSSNRNMNIIRLLENDRQRIAGGLHDTSLQNLSHIIHKLELSGMFIEQDPVRAKQEIKGAVSEIRCVIDDIRDCIYDLRALSLDNFALFSSINQIFKEINNDNKYIIDTDIKDVSRENSLFEITVYRILQECIYNIHYHANASRIYLLYEEIDNFIHIVVSDNGCGFDVDAVQGKHFGMLLMKERVKLLGGKIEYHSVIGEGTEINIKIPITE